MSAKAYLCIGGPLDGHFAMTDDFADAPYHWEYPSGKSWRTHNGTRVDTGPAGLYHHLEDKYVAFNASGRGRKVPSMVWIHVDLLKMPISPRLR